MKLRSVLVLVAMTTLTLWFVACQRSALPASSDGTTTTQASSGSEAPTESSSDAAVAD